METQCSDLKPISNALCRDCSLHRLTPGIFPCQGKKDEEKQKNQIKEQKHVHNLHNQLLTPCMHIKTLKTKEQT